MKTIQLCMIGRCHKPATTLHKSTGVWRCRKHQKELDDYMAIEIDKLARKLAEMTPEEASAWMKEPADNRPDRR